MALLDDDDESFQHALRRIPDDKIEKLVLIGKDAQLLLDIPASLVTTVMEGLIAERLKSGRHQGGAWSHGPRSTQPVQSTECASDTGWNRSSQ